MKRQSRLASDIDVIILLLWPPFGDLRNQGIPRLLVQQLSGMSADPGWRIVCPSWVERRIRDVAGEQSIELPAARFISPGTRILSRALLYFAGVSREVAARLRTIQSVESRRHLTDGASLVLGFPPTRWLFLGALYAVVFSLLSSLLILAFRTTSSAMPLVVAAAGAGLIVWVLWRKITASPIASHAKRRERYDAMVLRAYEGCLGICREMPSAVVVLPSPGYPSAIALPNRLCVLVPDVGVVEMPWSFRNSAAIAAFPGMKQVLDRADLVVAYSDHVLERHVMPIVRPKLSTVIPHGVPPGFSRAASLNVIENRRAARNRQVLGSFTVIYPTQDRPNKNLATAIKACSLAATELTTIRLLLTARGPLSNQTRAALDQAPSNLEVQFKVDLSQDELNLEYQRSTLALSTAVYEATFYFFPVFEALVNGLGCLIPDIAVNRHVCGGPVDISQFSFDPTDPQGVADLILRWRSEPEALALLQLASLDRIARRTWAEVGNEYLKAFRSIEI